MKQNILFILSLCIVLFSCSDKDDPIKDIVKPPIEEKDPFITLKKTNIDFTNEGGSESISIESNVTWTTKSSAGWCTVTPSSGNKSTTSITLTAPANEDYDNRSCTVTLESGNITKIITVNQGENLGLLVTQDRYELGNAESTIKVEVKANVEFEVEINDEWISKVDTRGLTTSELEFKIAENDTYGNREGSITIKQKGGNMSSTITVYQSQEDAIILSEKEFDLSNEAQSIDVEIKTNVEFELIIPEAAKSWVSYTPTRGLRTETLTLNIAENREYDDRSTEVYVKNKKTNLQDTLTINQSAYIGLPSVTTSNVKGITQTTAVSTGKISDEGSSPVKVRGVCWSTKDAPTIDDNKTKSGKGIGSFTSKITNLVPNTTYYVRAYATNSEVTGYGRVLSFTTYQEDGSAGTFTDSRDGNVYKAVKIANQVWMAENLKYLPEVVGPTIESWRAPCYYVYGYEGTDVNAAKARANYRTYGVLYNWPAAKAICPAGWHLPSNAEWKQLTDYLGGDGVAGGKLKETGTAHWKSPNRGATNETGFTALPGGSRYSHYSEFDYVVSDGYWWSASELFTEESWYWSMSYDSSSVGSLWTRKEVGFSVRCVRD